MQLLCFAIQDIKAGVFTSPFFMRSKGEALRAFMDSVADPSHAFHKHPGDFALVHVGAYDDSNGRLVTMEHPVHMALAAEILGKE